MYNTIFVTWFSKKLVYVANVYFTSMLKVSVTIAKSVKCLIIELLKVIVTVPMAAVSTEDAWLLVCELLVKVDCVLNTRLVQSLSKTNFASPIFTVCCLANMP